MKKYLAITAALALVLTACGHAAPDSTPTLTAATETTQATAAPAEQRQSIGSGALRLLTAAADGVYYQAFNDWEINYTDTMGRALIYAIDEQTGDARPVCSLPGCAHNSDTCPAWSDGNTTLCYGDGDEVYLLNFYYNDETSYYSWEQINSDHTRRTVLARIEPGLSVAGRGVAVDDKNLYYSVLDDDCHQTLWAVDKAGGQPQKVCGWDDLADGAGEYSPEMYTLLEVSGRQMTFAKTIQSTDARTKAIQICTVDLTDGSCTPQQRYERDAGTVFVTGDGMEKRDLISYRNDYQILTEGSRSGLANYNYQSGEVGYLDAAADSFTPVADGFPTTRAGWECYYSLTGFADGWLVWVDEGGCDENGNGTGDNVTRQYFCRDGVKTELTQQRYVPGKDVRNIRILDAQQGRVLAAYDTKTGTVHDVDKDGTTYTRPMNWDVYGVIALDDLLAGSTDFTPLNFAE